MAKVTLGGIEVEIDEDGFIQEPDKWSNAVADDISKGEEAFPMTEEHWKVVNYLRDYFIKYEIAPPIRMLCKQTGLDLRRSISCFLPGLQKGPARSPVFPSRRDACKGRSLVDSR